MLFSFSSIPYNCFEDVFKKVGFPELCRCRRTCKAMDEIIKKKINQGLRIQIETNPMASLNSFPHFHTLDWIGVFCNCHESQQKYRVQLNCKKKKIILTDARQLEGARLSTLMFFNEDEESYEKSKIPLEDFFRQAKCQFEYLDWWPDSFMVHPSIFSTIKKPWLQVRYYSDTSLEQVRELQQSFNELFLDFMKDAFSFSTELEDIVVAFEKFHLRSSKQLSMLSFIQRWVKGGKLREFKLYSIICKIEVDKKDPWLAANELYRHEHEKLNLYGYLIRNNRGNFLVLAGEKAIEGYIVEDVDTTVNLAMNHLDKEMAMYPSMLSEWKMECTEMLRANYENCTKS